MKVERTYYCEGPSNFDLPDSDERDDAEGCPHHATTTRPTPPPGFITVIERGGADGGNADLELNFCGWSCVMRYAAAFPPPEIVG